MFKIEKHIPLPENLVTGPRAMYPFADMAVGDSFWCPNQADSMAAAARKWAIRNESPFRFAARKEADGSRVWRKS